MEHCHSLYSTSALSSLFVTLTVILFIFSGHFSSFLSFSASKFQFSTPPAELRRAIPTPVQIRAVRSDGSTDRRRAGVFADSTVSESTKKLSQEELLERGLARARASIRMAASTRNNSRATAFENGVREIYRNPDAFYRSYMEMERRFKIYVYKEGDLPMVHDGPCKDLYTIEGRFIHEIEHGARRFKTNDTSRAHVFFMPFSVAWMVKYIYKPLSFDVSPLKRFVSDYVTVISTKYPFWNRTNGADHFMLSCHDWGPHASRGNSFLYSNSIRVLCNANTSEGFHPQKDASLPEIRLRSGKVPPKLLQPLPTNISRPYLSFFAGGLHGPIRPRLLQHWKGRDNDMQVHEYLPEDKDYTSYLLQSKYCLCPSGYEVASPRIVEAIYAECVPVILSEHYVFPFSDVLRWEAFSVRVETSEIPRLKEILMTIPEEKYRRLQRNLRAVRKHFELNRPAKRYDVFHMILHSIWLRRINARLM